VMQCVAVRCSQCVAVYAEGYAIGREHGQLGRLKVCCSVCVAACCSVLQCVTVSVCQCVAEI